MKVTNIFIFVLFFALQISAQGEIPKVLWKNLQGKYTEFEDVKPLIKNVSEKSVYVYPNIETDDVLIFDDDINQWTISKYVIGCGNSPNTRFLKYIKLKPDQSLDLSTWLDWDFLLFGGFSDGMLKDKNRANDSEVRYFKQGRKYKLRIFYSENKYKDIRSLQSSEFWIKPTD